MPSVVHCLGELEHIYDKHNLKLRTNGRITLSSPQSSDYDSSSNVQDLDALISSGTWTAGVNRLQLHVELLFDDIEVSDSSVSQATEDIGVVFRSAEIWSQLGLDVSLTINDSNKLLISLSNQSSTNADIRPPRCIPSTCLEDIGMTFYFSACRRTRNVSRAQVAVSGSAIEHTLASISPIDEDFERYYSPMSSPGGPKGVHGILTDGYTPWILGGSSVDNSPVSSQGSVSSNTYSTSSLEVLPPRPRYATQGVKLEILVRLMDSSLRRMISDCKPVRPGGVVLSSDAGCPKLAAIFPALFSPGYVKAVSQRTGLLPTIARTVSRVYRRTNSSRLRQRLGQLQNSSLSVYLDRGSTEDSDPCGVTFTSSVEVRLWFLARSKLIDPDACRGLKSLSTSNIPGSGSHEMLDEPSDDAGDVMLDGGEALIFDANGDAMELDKTSHLDLFHEQSLDGIVDGGEVPFDDDLFWEHSLDEVAYDKLETLGDKFCGASASEPGNDMVC